MEQSIGRGPCLAAARRPVPLRMQPWRSGCVPFAPAVQPLRSSQLLQQQQWQQLQPGASRWRLRSSRHSSSSSNSSSGGSGAPGQPPRALGAAAGDRGSPSSELSLDAGDAAAAVGGTLQSRIAAAAACLAAVYKFSRPHTMLGTFISVCSISLLALGPGDFGAPALRAFLQALSSALLMNICIVGINQIYDIEIDRVNKPYLPLAAGDFGVGTGVAIVVATGAAALAIGLWAASPPLLATLGGSLALGLAYSTDLPFLRWKRWPLVAAGCILAVRAVLVQLGFFLHMRGAVGAASATAGTGALGVLGTLSRPVLFATAFMLLFSIVIALFKDIPDVKGDSKAGLQTLSVRLGTKRVFWVCIGLLEAAYAGAIVVGLGSQALWSRVATVGAHAAMGAYLFWRAKRTDLTSSASIYKCYMRVWLLFYAEYLLLPLFR